MNKALKELEADGQYAAHRLRLAELGIIQISDEERRELSIYAKEWMSKFYAYGGAALQGGEK